MKIWNNIFTSILAGYILTFLIKCLIAMFIDEHPVYINLLFDQATIIIGIIGGLSGYFAQKIYYKKKTEK